MNKKFLIGALLVALSTAGYAFDYTHQDVQSGNTGFVGAEKGQTSFNEIKDELNRLDSTKLDKNTFYDAYNELHMGQSFTDETLKTHRQEIDALDKDIQANKNDIAANKAEQDKINAEQDKVNAEQDRTNASLQAGINKNHQLITGNTTILNDKIDKNTSELNDKIDANKAEQDKINAAQKDKDAEQDAAIALGDRVNNVQNQQIGNLQSQNLEQDKNIQANKDAIAQNKNDIEANKNDIEANKNDIEANKNAIAANKAEQDKVNAAQKENNEQQQAAIDKNTSNIKDHGNRLDTLENNFAQYDGRLSGLEKKVDHLDDKMNKGLSLMAAMNAVDFQNVQTGEMAIGAGVGHYGNAQSVALGVAYSPVEDLTVNAKYSVTAGDPDSFAVGAGATYKFKVGR